MKTDILTMAFQRIRTRFHRGDDDSGSDSDDARTGDTTRISADVIGPDGEKIPLNMRSVW